MKSILVYAGIAGLIVATISIYSLYTKNHELSAQIQANKLHYEAQIAILKVPKEKKDTQKEVIRIVYKDVKGYPVTVEKEIIRVITETEPVLLPVTTKYEHNTYRRIYLSGAYGISGGPKGIGYGHYSLAMGYDLFSNLSLGARFTVCDGIRAVAIETTIRF